MKYRTIVADPPWEMRGGGPRGRGDSPRHRLPYPTMRLDEICAVAVDEWSTEDANLFLWSTEAFVLDGSAKVVVSAWGFRSPRVLIWRKSQYGFGEFPRRQHELCVVATRGPSTWLRRDISSVQDWPVTYGKHRLHSAKPEGFLDLVEQVSPGPYLELFARRQRLGWDRWGNEVDTTLPALARMTSAELEAQVHDWVENG